MRVFRPRGVDVAAFLCVLLTSCMVGPNYREPETKFEGHWKKRSGVSDRPPSYSEAYWWRNFHDPVLNELVEAAYRNNPLLQVAGVRILEARAQLNETIGNLFPQRQQLLASARGNWSSNPSNDWTLLGMGQNYFASQALLSVSWEIDFWGKFRRQIQANRAEYLAQVAAYDDALVTLIADVANTYVNIRTLQARIDVAEQNIRLQSQSVEIAQAKLKSGQVSPLDEQQAEALLARTQADLPTLRDALQQSENGLAVLLGETPQQAERRVARPGPIPSAPASIAAGIPIDLLRRRPDVREAGLTAAAQSARIGVAFADLLPSFSLNGTFGYATEPGGVNSLSHIFNWQETLLNSAGSMVVPIFNYGRLTNQVRVRDAAFQRAILNYQNKVLNAQREVENGLSAFTQGKERVARLESAVAASRLAAAAATQQYQAGSTDYTTVLTAQQSLAATDDALAATEGSVDVGLIAIYRALGGGWQLRNGNDVISDAVKKQMAGRTNWGQLLEPSRHLPAVSPEEQPISKPPVQ